MTAPTLSEPAAAQSQYAGQKGNLVDVQNLKVYFPIRAGMFQRTIGSVKAVDDISFEVRRGETLGLVGESGWARAQPDVP